MTKRLQTILNHLICCKRFADVGCDHGYVARAMLETGKAERVIVSDISAPSLKKAQTLLEPYGQRVKAVVCDGLALVDDDCDQVLIAGMGGEEIISILSSSHFLPKRLVLQPMKNADKLRKSLLSCGYRIIKDYIFRDDKFYVLIVAERGEDSYSEDEIFFGRDNLLSPTADFLEFAKREHEKYCTLVTSEGLSDATRAELTALKNKYAKVLK
jgi:tRNA (adenine22-N1)-methyltransferase